MDCPDCCSIAQHAFLTQLLGGASWLLAVLAACNPQILTRNPTSFLSPPPIKSSIQLGLGPQLSKNASLYFPGSPDFTNYTKRWSASSLSDFAVVVVPATAHDVAETARNHFLALSASTYTTAQIKYANLFDIPFQATNKGHGTSTGLSTARHGIEISLRALDQIIIAKGGKSALLGGGAFVDQTIRAFAAEGKASASGGCGCVGMMGPGLGGGLGFYQGFFGLVTDNIVNMDVVIANGSLIHVSATSNTDLFWGMRGAGHNFGIVTQFEYKIYDAIAADWYFAALVFTEDKLEGVFGQLNALMANGTQDQRMSTYSLFALDPGVSSVEPSVILHFMFAGTEAEAKPFIAPFIALGAATSTGYTTPYTNIPHASGSGVTDAVCQPAEGSRKLYPVGLLEYNTTAIRSLYNLFFQMLQQHPQLGNSIVQFEGYAMQGVKAVDADRTAYAHRGDNILVSFDAFYPDLSFDKVADTYGEQARAIIHAGDVPGHTLNSYVNYASSNETPEQNYGYEPWRLAKLRKLKKKFDPEGKFDFYSPVN